MKTEFEVKIRDANFELVKNKLTELGAQCVHERRMMRRYILDYEDVSLQKQNAYIRLRDEGDKITTTYKLTEARTVDGVKELETEVADLETMLAIYEKLGLIVHSVQETYRESWQLDGIEIEFDEWPWLEPFFEVEAHSEAEVRGLVEKLGYNWQDAIPGDVIQLYQDVFDVGEWEISRKAEITFGPIPDWLEAKRR